MYSIAKKSLPDTILFKKEPALPVEDFKCQFYEQAKVLIILSQILGSNPISRDKLGKPEFKLTSHTMIYSIIVFTISSIAGGMVSYIHYKALSHANSMSFDDQIIFIGALLFQGFHFMPLLTFFEGKRRVKYFNDWYMFELKYYKITKKCLNYKMAHLQYVILFALLLTSLFFIYFSISHIDTINNKYNLKATFPEKILLAGLFFYYLWLIHICLVTWSFTTLGIRKTARILLKDFQDIRLRSRAFDELYGLWLDLKHLTEDTGNVFSITILYYLSYTFMMTIGSTYSFFANLAKVETENKYEYAAFSMISAFAFGLIGDSAHRTIFEIGYKFHHLLLQILANERDPQTIRGIKWFIQTISLNPLVVCLSGYVSLDRGFNVSMLGALVTYIVVVLQFRLTSDQQVCNLLPNNTNKLI